MQSRIYIVAAAIVLALLGLAWVDPLAAASVPQLAFAGLGEGVPTEALPSWLPMAIAAVVGSIVGHYLRVLARPWCGGSASKQSLAALVSLVAGAGLGLLVSLGSPMAAGVLAALGIAGAAAPWVPALVESLARKRLGLAGASPKPARGKDGESVCADSCPHFSKWKSCPLDGKYKRAGDPCPYAEVEQEMRLALFVLITLAIILAPTAALGGVA